MDSNIFSQFQAGSFSALTSWSFLSCCLCMAVLILTFKRAFRQFWPDRYGKSQTHGFFTLSYLIAGLIAAIPKDYLMGSTYFNRVILGILASGASLLVYHAAFKRFGKLIGVPDNYINELELEKEEAELKQESPKVEPKVELVKTDEKPVDKVV